MKILIAGAGAMGARFGYMLYESGNEVVFADYWDENVDAINKQGLQVIVDEKDLGNYNIRAFKPNEVKGVFDLIFVFTKALELNQMMQDIKHVINEKTYLICLLNGLGNVDNILPYVKANQVLLGTTLWTSGLDGPGVVNAIGTGSIFLQLLEPRRSSTLDPVIKVLNDAGLNVSLSKDVKQALWHKVALNCVFNAYCSLIDCNIAEYGKYPFNEKLTNLILDEIVSVGRAEGVIVLKDVITESIRQELEDATNQYPPLYLDIINKRKTEIDYLNGAIAKLGKKHRVATPVCSAITHMIHVKEMLYEKKK